MITPFLAYMTKNIIVPYLTRFVMRRAKIIPKDDVTNCGQLDTNSIVFTIFGGNWNSEKNKE